jgi:hypothetical protein
VNKGIDAVDPVQQGRSFQKPLLKGHFPEDTELLLYVDQLESMPSSDMNCPLNNGDSGKSSA